MRILFIYPDICKGSCGLHNGIATISSVLKDSDHQTFLIHVRKEISKNDLLKKIEKTNPDLIAFSSTTNQHPFVELYSEWIKQEMDILTVCGGVHTTLCPEDVLKSGNIDMACIGEGEYAMLELVDKLSTWQLGKEQSIDGIRNLWVKKGGKTIKNPLRPLIENLDGLPFPDRELFDYQKILKGRKYRAEFWAGRGCPFNCLSGNTKVNTIYGNIPIKSLVGNKIGVYTYDSKTKRVFITDATNIRKIGKRKLVRVTFDDGSFVDCTQDHRFLTFKNGNQFVTTREIIKIAKDLRYKDSVRAIKFYVSKSGYCDVFWGRRKHKRRSRTIMEYLLKRELKSEEEVHHKDRNKSNDIPSNLILCETKKEHLNYHPEVSERMRNDNPQKYSTKESYEKMANKIRGIKRSLKTRIKLRESKLGEKNPNYKHGRRTGTPSRIKEINHKVVSVKPMGYNDVYDLEVPSTHWFFANNVLVHNCSYCCNHALRKIYEGKGKYVRIRSVDNLLIEIGTVTEQYKVKSLLFHDDIFTLFSDWIREFCEKYPKRFDFKFSCNVRVETVNRRILSRLKEAGCDRIAIGVESGNEWLRRNILNRQMTNKQIIKVFRVADEIGLKTYSFNMMGLPFETPQMVEDTMKLNEIVSPTSGQVSVFYPYPSTELWKICEKNNFLTGEEKTNYFSDESVLNLPTMSKDEIKEYYHKFSSMLLGVKVRKNYPKMYPFFKALKSLLGKRTESFLKFFVR